MEVKLTKISRACLILLIFLFWAELNATAKHVNYELDDETLTIESLTSNTDEDVDIVTERLTSVMHPDSFIPVIKRTTRFHIQVRTTSATEKHFYDNIILENLLPEIKPMRFFSKETTTTSTKKSVRTKSATKKPFYGKTILENPWPEKISMRFISNETTTKKSVSTSATKQPFYGNTILENPLPEEISMRFLSKKTMTTSTNKYVLAQKHYFNVLMDTNTTKDILRARSTKSSIIKILLFIPPNQLDCATRDAFTPGNNIFREQNCFYDNCYLVPSYNRPINIRDDKYEAILFFGRFLIDIAPADLPKTRSQKQRYIYVQLESNDMFPVCQDIFDNFFNWTMTYKLDSDIPWPHFSVKNLWNRTVGPKINMNWNRFDQNSHAPIKFDLKMELRKKSKMVAWFASNCKLKSGRREFVLKLKKELERHNYTLDTFGRCGTISCPEGPPYTCKNKVKDDYVFFLAMESYFGEDYITSKVLTALQNNAIPIVYSHANYSRFLPPGSYLDALDLGPTELVRVMIDVINNSTFYEMFFQWRNYYIFESNYDHRRIACKLCEKLNRDHRISTHKNFREWWNKKFRPKCKSQYAKLF